MRPIMYTRPRVAWAIWECNPPRHAYIRVTLKARERSRAFFFGELFACLLFSAFRSGNTHALFDRQLDMLITCD